MVRLTDAEFDLLCEIAWGLHWLLMTERPDASKRLRRAWQVAEEERTPRAQAPAGGGHRRPFPGERGGFRGDPGELRGLDERSRG